MTPGRELSMALDPVVFAAEALGLPADEWQARALRSTSRRMILNCSRQSGKSTIASVKVLHRAVFRPGSLCLVISPSLRQSGELFRKVGVARAALTWLPEDLEVSRTALMLANGSRILSLPGAEDTIRGFSAVDLAIEDEAAQVDDDLYRAVRPMLAVSNGALMLMSTPRGKRGHYWYEYTQGGEEWERYEVKAADCPRIPPAFLASERRALGDRWYRQEYECSFEEMQDAVFSWDAVEDAFSATVRPLFDEADIIDVTVAPLFDVDEIPAEGRGGGGFGAAASKALPPPVSLGGLEQKTGENSGEWDR